VRGLIAKKLPSFRDKIEEMSRSKQGWTTEALQTVPEKAL